MASSYKPPDDLVEFLKAGPPPVYIGFGSIVVDNPNEFTNMIFSAVKRAGVRALVSKGWGGLGGNDAPEGVFLLGNVPHDWLFQYVSCVVHHGGAGTTAIGIAMGKPTVVVPFFGDQPFWGSMIYHAGAGPEPVPYKKMTEELLAESITKALSPEIQNAVKEMSEKIADENGSEAAAASFHQAVNMDTMRCLILPDRVAVWRVKKTNIRLSSLAAATILDQGLLQLKDIKLCVYLLSNWHSLTDHSVRHRDWYIDEGASGPITAAVAVASGTLTNIAVNINHYAHSVSKSLRKKPESKDTTPDTEDTPPLAYSQSLDYIPSSHPVQRAVNNYSPQHLEALSYAMASNSLPDRRPISKDKKAHSWSPYKRTNTLPRAPTGEAPHDHGRVHEATSETGHFAYDMLGIGLKAPVAFFYNLANGFHNAPLYLLRDTTVRRRDQITGIGSGTKAAGKEFTLGLFDGLTGLVIHPFMGAWRDGLAGLGKGVGQGLGGLVFKSGAAAFGIPGYTLKGLEKQLAKRYSRDLKAKILTVRLRQSLTDYSRASEEEKQEILRRWRELDCKI